MTGNDDWYDDDDMDGGYGQAQPDNVVKQLRDQLKAKAKAEKELQQKLEELQGQVRRSTISEVLKSQGVNAKVADLIPSTVEPTKEGIGKWLEEYGELFGVQSPEGTTDSSSAPKEPDPQTVSQMTAMSQVAASGEVAITNQPVTKQDLENASTMEEFLALLKKGA